MSFEVVAGSTSLQRPVRFTVENASATIADMVDQAIAHRIVPARFRREGRIEIDGHEILRENWRKVRPRQGRHIFMAITHAGGGEGDGAKNIIAAVAAVLLVVVTAGIATAGLPFLGIAAGSLAAQVTAGAVGPASYPVEGLTL